MFTCEVHNCIRGSMSAPQYSFILQNYCSPDYLFGQKHMRCTDSADIMKISCIFGASRAAHVHTPRKSMGNAQLETDQHDFCISSKKNKTQQRNGVYLPGPFKQCNEINEKNAEAEIVFVFAIHYYMCRSTTARKFYAQQVCMFSCFCAKRTEPFKFSKLLGCFFIFCSLLQFVYLIIWRVNKQIHGMITYCM